MKNNQTDWQLFLDDERFPVKEDEWLIARNIEEAKQLIKKHGCPNVVSLDHDLGFDTKADAIRPTGCDFVKWLVEECITNAIEMPPNFKFTSHSMNPVGKKNIESLLANYVR